MALIVEDGTGKADANALASLDAFKQYCDARGTIYTSSTDEEIEAAIIRGTDYVSALSWQGARKYGRGSSQGAQALAWPRTGVWDADGWYVPETVVPVEVTQATIEVAVRELAQPGAMSPDVVMGERIKSEVYSKVSFTYDTTNVDALDFVPIVMALRRLIGQFLNGGDPAQVTPNLSGEIRRG